MQKNAKLKQLVRETGVTAEYLTKRCKEEVPGWCIAPLPEKKAFTPAQKQKRRHYAERAVQYPMEQWQSTVFLDEHKFYRRVIPLPAVHIAGQRRKLRRTNKDMRKRRYPWSYPRLHFLYGVHWKLGVLGPYWISDCEGWRHARHYQVSNHAQPATHRMPVQLMCAAVTQSPSLLGKQAHRLSSLVGWLGAGLAGLAEGGTCSCTRLHPCLLPLR